MFQNELYLGSDVFAKQSVRPLSATYADNNQQLNNPRTLTISHEVGKSGQVSTAIILDDVLSIPIGNSLVNDRIRVLHKIQYNPFGGRPGLAEAIRASVRDLANFVCDDENLSKILNKES